LTAACGSAYPPRMTHADVYREIANRAAAQDISLAELCRRARIHRSTLQRFKNGSEVRFSTVRALEEALDAQDV
jgi:DNA-binding Xre family transcriptional regulator